MGDGSKVQCCKEKYCIGTWSVRSIPFLSFIEPNFAYFEYLKYSLGMSNFLEEISSLSRSVVFLYIVAVIAEEGFLSRLAIFWNSALK